MVGKHRTIYRFVVYIASPDCDGPPCWVELRVWGLGLGLGV